MSTSEPMALARVIKDFWWECEAGDKPAKAESGEPSSGDHALASAILAAGYQAQNAPQFVFYMRYIDWSDDPYYHRDWHGSYPIEVVASNKQEAVEKARAVLGPAPTRRVWGIKVMSIKDIRIPNEGI